jgi:hypothetical protein
MDFARSLKVSEPELFSICREYYSEGIARVASVALYWSQFAQHQFRGKLGIYKTDDDLGKSIGRHPKTAGANLMKVCAPLGQSSRTDLFEVTYGPKAGQNGGRCRWLFVTPRGEQIIQVAREHRLIRSNAKRNRGVRHERRHESIDAPSSDSAARRSAAAVRSHRQPENTPTLYTEDLPTRRSVNLSAAPREISIEDSQERQEEEEEKINRIPELWKVACERSGRRDLVWRPSDVRRFADEFLEIASMRTVRDLPEEKLLERLTLLCGDLNTVVQDMSAKFSDFNKNGLKCQTFATYGDTLLAKAGEVLEKQAKHVSSQRRLKHLSDL